jgi:hypothetical protein
VLYRHFVNTIKLPAYGGTSVGPVGGTPMGSRDGAGPGSLAGTSTGTSGCGTSGGVPGRDGDGGCWFAPMPLGLVSCMEEPRLRRDINRAAPPVVPCRSPIAR